MHGEDESEHISPHCAKHGGCLDPLVHIRHGESNGVRDVK